MPLFAVPLCLLAPPDGALGRPDRVGSVYSLSYPIQVHYDRASDQALATEVLGWAETSWAVQVETLGFPEPILPDAGIDGDELDIYLTSTLSAGELWVVSADYTDQVIDDGRMSTWASIALGRSTSEYAFPELVAHAFNHVLQHAIDFTEGSRNFREATALAAAAFTFDVQADWSADVDAYQETPWRSSIVSMERDLFDETALTSAYDRGAVLWPMMLVEARGGSGDVLVDLWLAAAQEDPPDKIWSREPDALDAILEVSELSLGNFMNELARIRFLVAGRWDDRGLSDAATWPGSHAVPIEASYRLGELPVEHEFEERLEVMGVGYVAIELDGRLGTIEVEVLTDRNIDSALLLMWWSEEGEVGEVSDYGGLPIVSMDAGGLDSIIVALSHIGSPGWDGDSDSSQPGDQRLAIRFEADDPPEPDPLEERPPLDDTAGCGCVSLGGIPTGLFFPLLSWIGLRRRRLPHQGAESRRLPTRSQERVKAVEVL